MQELTAHQRAVQKYKKNMKTLLINKKVGDNLKTLAHNKNLSISKFIELLLKNYNI